MADKPTELTPLAKQRLQEIATQLKIPVAEVVRRLIGIHDFLDEKTRTGDATERLLAKIILGRQEE